MSSALPLAVLRGHRSPVHSVCFLSKTPTLGDNDDKEKLWIASGDANGYVLIWDVKQKRVSDHGQLSGGGVVRLLSEEDAKGGGRLASQTRQGRISMWASPEDLIRNESPVVEIDTEASAFCRMDVCWLESLVSNAMRDDGTIGVWDFRSPKAPCAMCQPPQMQTLGGSSWGMIMDTKFVVFQGGACVFVVAAYEDGCVRVCDVGSGGTNVASMEVRVQPIGSAALSIALHPDSKKEGKYTCVAGGAAPRLAFFTLDFVARVVDGPVSFVSAASSSNDGGTSQVSFEAGNEYEHNIASDPGRGAAEIAIRPDGRIVAVASWDSRVRILHRRTFKHLAVLKHHRLGVSSVAFSSDSKYLASGSNDQHVLVWDVFSNDIKLS